MRPLIKRLLFPIFSRWYRRKNDSVQYYSRYGMRLKILPSVFHPGYFFSTNIFIRFLSHHKLSGKHVLELGAGSGMISFFAAKNGAVVTATDINPVAIQGMQENSRDNSIPIKVLETNLLEGLSIKTFDYVIINPPYYPKNAQNMAESAFYCGEDFAYFNGLFDQLKQQSFDEKTAVFMILSQDCQIEHILELAAGRSIHNDIVYETRKFGEKNIIFRLYKS